MEPKAKKQPVIEKPCISTTFIEYYGKYEYTSQLTGEIKEIREFMAERNIIQKETGLHKSIFQAYGDKYELRNGAFRFIYNDEEMMLVAAPQPNSHEWSPTLFVCCNDWDILEDFTMEFQRFLLPQAGYVRIYDSRWLGKARTTKQNMDTYEWDDLILADDIKQQIRSETEAFLSGEQKAIYEKLGLSHKRGFIFMGEPGCGKTLTARIIASTSNLPFIYVRSINFIDDINAIYSAAKQCAPCIVLFEDIDSLINITNKSKFLNIIDGITNCKQILTIVTTNHPEWLDEAILNRPSRFDKKWVFSAPDKKTREIYLRDRLARVFEEDLIKEAEASIKYVIDKSDKFTCAQLQELIICAAMAEPKEGLNKALRNVLNEAVKQVALGDANKAFNAVNAQKDAGNVGFRSNVPQTPCENTISGRY